jgi:hypothetical protein
MFKHSSLLREQVLMYVARDLAAALSIVLHLVAKRPQGI